MRRFVEPHRSAIRDQRSAILLSFQRALLSLVAIALLAGLVPAGIALDRRLARELDVKARDDLRAAARVLADRTGVASDAMMMYAKEIADAPGLAPAMRAGDRAAALAALARAAASYPGERALLVGADGASWAGPAVPRPGLEATRRGEMPFGVGGDARGEPALYQFSIAPVVAGGVWLGAAGVARALDDAAAATLGALTRSDVALVAASGRVTGTTLADTAAARALAVAPGPSGDVATLRLGGRQLLHVRVPLGGGAHAIFARDLAEERAVLPKLRRVAAVSAGIAIALGLLLGALFATRVARPVEALATAADRLAGGDSASPLARSTIREIDRVSRAFDAMRQALAARLEDLERANAALADRTARLGALQNELMQRERLAATARLIAQLAHEIRNPVANLRNLLELIHRRTNGDAESRRYADLAIDELLRMHELAEQLLDVNRPRGGASTGDAVLVARETAFLVGAGDAGPEIAVSGCEHAPVAMAPDALKQVLINLVHNAREAIRSSGSSAGRIDVVVHGEGPTIVVEVKDDGPGIPPEVLPRIFDPFFTTKQAVHGVGLGLFVAEGLVRATGGRITAANDPATGGAWFTLELPRAGAPVVAGIQGELL